MNIRLALAFSCLLAGCANTTAQSPYPLQYPNARISVREVVPSANRYEAALDQAALDQQAINRRITLAQGPAPPIPQNSKIESKQWQNIAKITFEVIKGWTVEGTGVLVRDDVVVTANTIVRGETATVEFPDGSYTGRVIGTNPKFNWALLRLDRKSKVKAMPIINGSQAGAIKEGDTAWIFGYGDGKFGHTQIKVTGQAGELWTTDGSFRFPPDITISMADFGGPIMNKNSLMVGLYTGYHEGKIYGFGMGYLMEWVNGTIAEDNMSQSRELVIGAKEGAKKVKDATEKMFEQLIPAGKVATFSAEKKDPKVDKPEKPTKKPFRLVPP